MHVAEVEQALTAWWGMAEEDAHAFWNAVERSQTLRPTVLRANLALVSDPVAMARFVRQSCTPFTVLQTLEDLVQEGQLSGPRATRMQTCLHARIDPSGQWRTR